MAAAEVGYERDEKSATAKGRLVGQRRTGEEVVDGKEKRSRALTAFSSPSPPTEREARRGGALRSTSGAEALVGHEDGSERGGSCVALEDAVPGRLSAHLLPK